MGHANDVITRQIYTHLFDADSVAHADRLAAGGRPKSVQVSGSVATLGRAL